MFDEAFGNQQVDPGNIADTLYRQSEPTLPPGHVDPGVIADRMFRKMMPGAPRQQAQSKKEEPKDYSQYGDLETDLSQYGELEKPAEAGPAEAGSAEAKKDEWGGYLSVIGKGLVRGAAEQIGGNLQGAQIAADTANKQIGSHVMNAPEYEAIQKASGISPQAPIPSRPITEGPLYKAGKAIKESATRNLPFTKTEQESVTGRVASGLGGFAGMMPGMAVGGLVGGPVGATVAGALQMAASGAASTFDDAISKGANEQTAAKAAGLNGLASGALGAIPLGAVLAPIKKLAPTMVGWAATQLEQYAIANPLLTKIGVGAGLFATVGEAQEYIAQQIAKSYYDPKAGYDPDTKRVIASLITGGIVGAAGHALTPKEIDKVTAPLLSPPHDLSAEEAGARFREKFDEMVPKRLRRPEEAPPGAAPLGGPPQEPPPTAKPGGGGAAARPPVEEPKTPSDFAKRDINEEAVNNQAYRERVLGRAGLTDEQISAMSPEQQKVYTQEALRRGIHVGEEPPVEVAATTDTTSKINSRHEPSQYKDATGHDVDPAFQQFFRGDKPLLFVSDLEIAHSGLGEQLSGRPHLDFKMPAFKGDPTVESVYYQPGHEADARRLVDLYTSQTKKEDLGYADFHREVGRLLGYPKSEIDAFIQTSIKKGTYKAGSPSGRSFEIPAEGTTEASLPVEPAASAPSNSESQVTKGLTPSQADIIPDNAHHAHGTIEKALTDVGIQPHQVSPVDIAQAAEYTANLGLSPADSFVGAVAKRLVDQGHLPREAVEKVLGHEKATAILDPSPTLGHEPPVETAGTNAPGKAPQNAAKQPGGGGQGRAPAGPESGKTTTPEAAKGVHAGPAATPNAGRVEPHAPGQNIPEYTPSGGAAPTGNAPSRKSTPTDAEGPRPHIKAARPAESAELFERGAAETPTTPVKPAKGAEPFSLLQFIAGEGGLKRTSDLLALGLNYKSYVHVPGKGNRGLLNNKRGLTLDHLHERLVEDGYLERKPTDRPGDSGRHRQILDMIDQELRGTHKHVPLTQAGKKTKGEEEAVQEQNEARQSVVDEARTRLKVALSEHKIPLGGLHPDTANRATELMIDHDLEPLDAINEAALQIEREESMATKADEQNFDLGGTDFDWGVPSYVNKPAAPQQGRTLPEKGAPPAEGEKGHVREAGKPAHGPGPSLGQETKPVPSGGPVTEPGVEGKPQYIIAGTERISNAQHAQRESAKPLTSKSIQKPADTGLFGQDALQSDLVDLSRQGNAAARASQHPDISKLAKHETALPKSESQVVQGIQQDKNLPEVDRWLRGVLPRHGPQAIAEPYAGEKREQQGLQSGKLLLGDQGRADAEHTEKSADIARREDTNSARLVDPSGTTAGHGKQKNQERHDSQGGHEAWSDKGLRGATVADISGRDIISQGVGEKAWNTSTSNLQAIEQELAAQPSADSEKIREQRKTGIQSVEEPLRRKILERGRSGRPTQTEPLPIGTEEAILEEGARRLKQTPAERARQQDIKEGMANEVERMLGRSFNIAFAPKMTMKPDAAALHGKMASGESAGITIPAHKLIIMSMDPSLASFRDISLSHEVWHGFKEVLADDRERALIDRETPRFRKALPEHYDIPPDKAATISNTEVQAYVAGSYMAARAKGDPGSGLGLHIGVRGIFEKMFQTLRRIGNFLRMLGYQTSEDILNDLYEGKMAGRTPRELTGDETYAAVAFVPTIKQKLGKIKEKYVWNFQPELFSDRALQAEPLFADYVSSINQRRDAIYHKLDNDWNFMNKQPEVDQFQFMRAMETGAQFNIQPYTTMARNLKSMLETAYRLEIGFGSKADYIENYLPHVWKKPEKFRKHANDLTKQIGPIWFQKKRYYELIDDGRAAGLELISTNPIDLVTHRLNSSIMMQERMRLLNKLKDMGLAIEAKRIHSITNQALEWQSIHAPDRQEWMLAPDIQPLWKNAVEAKGLYQLEGFVGNSFRNWMKLKNIWVPLKLSLSAFHPVHVLHINYSDAFARAWDQAKHGRPIEGLGTAFRGVYGPMQAAPGFSVGAAVGALAGATILPGVGLLWGGLAGSLIGSASMGVLKKMGMKDVPHPGKEYRRQWQKELDALPPQERANIRLMNEGGFVPQMSEQQKIMAKRRLAEAWQKNQYFRLLPALVRRGVEKLQAPIFEEWIPNLKAASYLEGASRIIQDSPNLLTNEIQRRAAMRILGRQVMSRYGEMFYNSLFMNKTFKDSMIASFLSFGWQYGIIQQFLKAPFEMAAKIGQALKLDSPSVTRKTRREASNGPAFVIAYVSSFMMIFGAMTYGFTGKMPIGMDYLLPRIGGENADGSPRRLSNPSYSREVPMAFSHIQERGGGIGGTISGLSQMVWNKTMFEPFKEIYENRNYWGYNIWDPEAPEYKQVWQTGKFLFKDVSNPITITGLRRALDTGGSWAVDAPLAFMGFGPAPAYAEKNAIQNRISHLYKEYVAPKSRPYTEGEESADRMRVRSHILLAKKNKDSTALQAAKEEGKKLGLSPTYMAHIGQMPSDVYLFSRLPNDLQTSLLIHNTSNLEEFKRYYPKAHLVVRSNKDVASRKSQLESHP